MASTSFYLWRNNMPSVAEVANTYHSLARKDIKLTALLPFEKWLPTKILGVRVHWNAIWHHRLAIEIACQFKEDGDSGTYINELVKYHKEYKKLHSTLPLYSNKSISHYVGLCALDCILHKPNEAHIDTLAKVFNRVAVDGAFTEGAHYSKYVTDCFDRVEELFEGWYGQHSNDALQQSYKDIVSSLKKVKRWQRLISDTAGIMAVIGDGWNEAVSPIEENGDFHYSDMTIHRKDGWLAIKNHRQNKFSLHQHPHCDEILIAHKNDWLIKGTGMPSYKQVMAHPLKWRWPRNHFFSESNWDWWVIWRHRVGWLRDTADSRRVEIDGNTLTIIEKGKKTLRFPGTERRYLAPIDKKIEWSYGEFNFVVEGVNIEVLRGDAVCASTTYGNEQIIPVLRVKGENIITRITVND